MELPQIAEWGIVGAGGAGFPTHVKLAARPEILVVNAAECEPLLHKDGEIIENRIDALMDGIGKAQSLCGAKGVIIGIKKKHRENVKLLESKVTSGMTVIALPDFYPAGDEMTLVYVTTGRVIQPGALPISCGCIVQNVETLYNIGIGEPVTRKFLSVAGAVDRPVTFSVPIGASINDVLSNVNITAGKFSIVINGVMMGNVEPDLTTVITKRTGGIIVLPDDHNVVRMLRRSESEKKVVFLAKSSCDQCSYCTELCPRYLLGHPVRPEMSMRNRMFSLDETGNAFAGSAFCCDCNLCTLYSCPEDLDPRGACRIEKKILRSKNIKWSGLPVKPHPMLRYRGTPTGRLKERLGLSAYDDHAPLENFAKMPQRVTIPLSQHAGAPAHPCVKVGDTVKAGDPIGNASGAISAMIHASIAGTITAAGPSTITIQAKGILE
jgi:Na+-translocating ferredoxin:NAD+ oxidoreductase RnfC subunit